MLIGTDAAVELINPQKAKPVSTIEFSKLQLQIKPVSLFSVGSSDKGSSRPDYMLQSRNGWMLRLTITAQLELLLVGKHRIGQEGFARVPILTAEDGTADYYYYFNEEKLEIVREDTNWSSSEAFTVDEDDKVSHITSLAVHREGSSESIFIMVEGGRILHYTIFGNPRLIRLQRCFQLSSQTQSTIVLSSAVFSRSLFCAIRGDALSRLDIRTATLAVAEESSSKSITPINCVRQLNSTKGKLFAISTNALLQIDSASQIAKPIFKLNLKNCLINDFDVKNGLLAVATEEKQLYLVRLQE